MTRYEIENLFQTLAMSQGSYGRLLDNIYSQPEDVQEEIWEELENQHFADALDVILYVEG